MTFLLQMMSALAEPLGAIGYVLCGLLLPRLWIALAASAAWSLAMQAWESAQARAQSLTSATELLFPRLTLAVLLALAAFLAIEAWRERRTVSPS
ncbi:MAG: hypothetical protein IT562_12685 [Alphaproteobacteria bacterium]|nr:hypothetical protein [Alphaproteobacteria bacterium]